MKAMKMSAPPKVGEGVQRIEIKAPNLRVLVCEIVGSSPLVQARFAEKSIRAMEAKMLAGSTATARKKQRSARDFEDDFAQAQHISEEGWNGIPASAIRSACIAACRLVSLTMTLAKMSIFVLADGVDRVDGTPLVRLQVGAPERNKMIVRNANGQPDIRVRPMWRQWSARVRVQYDADQFRAEDVVNLLMRAGMQVGIGEGRPFSTNSNGLGWGTFTVTPKAEDTHAETTVQVGGRSQSPEVAERQRGRGRVRADPARNGLADAGVGG